MRLSADSSASPTPRSLVRRKDLAWIGYPCLSVRSHQPPDPWAGQLGLRLLQKRYMAFLGEVLRDEVSIQEITPERRNLAEAHVSRLLRFLEEHIRNRPAEWDLWIRW